MVVWSCRRGEAAGCGEMPSTLVDVWRAQPGLALTTTSAFGVGGRTRRLVIGEILTPVGGLLTHATSFRIRSPSVGAHCFGRTVL